MIVHCDQCSTNFRLDDAKVKDAGVRVRCSKCRHIFTVFPESPRENSEFDDMLKGFGPSAGAALDSSKEGVDGFEQEVDHSSEAFSSSGVDVSDAERGGSGSGEEPGDPLGDYITGGDELDGVDDGADSEFAESGSQLQGTEVDFSALFDESPPREEAAQQEFQGAALFEAGGIDVRAGEQAEDEPVHGEASPEPDVSGDDSGSFFLDTFPPEPDVEAHSEVPSPEEGSPTIPEFGDAFTSAPPAEEKGNGEDERLKHAVLAEPGIAAAEELPSLPPSSRRREHSVFPMLVTAISIVFLLLLAGGGLFFLKEGPKGFDRMGLGVITKWAGLNVEEEGAIAVRTKSGAFLSNAEAGEIFVVTGEALNGFRKPRAGIQVRGLIYGAKGEVLMRKIAYCGNILTQEQLKSLPLAKIEARMNNQFGDSLSNLGVEPGKEIPFVLVFTKVPSDAADYGVEVVSSTVAGK